MSVEVHVFFRGKLPDKPALARVLRERGFQLRFRPPKGSLERHSGFLPMVWDGEETGFEFDVVSDPAEMDEYRVDGVDPGLDRCAVFHLGGMTELFAAQCVSAALAELTGGVVYDPEEGCVLSLDEATAAARSTLGIVAASRARRPRGSRPADIRHYLKPLLSERKDLILRGRYLFIRGARHFLRGAWLGRTSDPMELAVCLQITRLYLPPDNSTTSCNGQLMRVWEPYFEPWLFNVLRHDAFDVVGRITGVVDIADYEVRRRRETSEGHMEHSVLDYLLAGERDRAEELVLEFERNWQPWWAEKQRAIFERDIEELCEECHKQEATNAEALKLGDMWEPAPFPVEVPKPVRRQSTDEAAFAATPWLASAENAAKLPPDAPGEMAFAYRWALRNGEPIMVGPLTREEAQAKYDNDERYCLFIRLPSGGLLILDRSNGWHPEDPSPLAQRRPTTHDYLLWLLLPTQQLYARFSAYEAEPGTTNLWQVSVRNLDGRKGWEISVHFGQGYWQSSDLHGDYILNSHGERPITDRERSLCAVAPPHFGEYEELLEHAKELLRYSGYGAFVG